MNRRNFIRNTGLTAASLALLSKEASAAIADNKVRIGIMGTGLRGQSHLELLLKRDDVDVVAICDVDAGMLNRARKIVDDSKKKMPQIFTGDNYAWKTMLEKTTLDGVIIASPWEWHSPMILGSLQAGIKYVGSEVILGITLDDHWSVVKAAEQYNAHVMMLENVCYRRDVMAVLNMVRQGVFGELMPIAKQRLDVFLRQVDVMGRNLHHERFLFLCLEHSREVGTAERPQGFARHHPLLVGRHNQYRDL